MISGKVSSWSIWENKQFLTHKGKTGLLFFILIALVVFERIFTYFNFSILYTDSDQTLLWQVAKDLQEGIFHGPCFYGQSYNPVIEPLFSLPLLSAGLNYYQALPLVTILLSTLPFLILSFAFYSKINSMAASLPLIICLLLPPEYLFLSSIPRGFVAGVFFAVLGFTIIWFKNSTATKYFGGMLMAFGIYANPNCILIFPLIIPLFFYEKKQFYKNLFFLIAGFLTGFFPLLLNYWYYNHHPEMIIHGSPNLEIKFSTFKNVLGRLDSYFNFVTPIFWKGGWLSLIFFPVIIFRLWKLNLRLESLTVIVLFVSIFFSFSIAKVGEGTNSIFFSGARMFLAYPFIALFLLFYFLQTLNESARKKIYKILIVLSAISFASKILFFDYFINDSMKGSKNSIVKIIGIHNLRKNCGEMISFGEGEVDLVMGISGGTPTQPVNYGCGCLLRDFPLTILPLYERRTWLMPQVMEKVYHKILIHGKDSAAWAGMKISELAIKRWDEERGWMVVENKLKTEELILKSGIKLY